MESRLRPLTLGEILDRTAQLYRSQFWLFAGIASVYSGAILLLSLLQIGGEEFLRVQNLTRYAIPLGATWMALMFFVSFVVGGIAVAANNRAVAWVHLGERATIRGAYAGILPRTGRYIWLMTIVTFMMWWPLALTYGAYVVGIMKWMHPLSKGAARQIPGPNTPPGDPAVVLIMGLATLLILLCLGSIAYALVMFLRYSLSIPAAVVENLKARQAIRRSVELSKGSRGRIFVLALLVIVIQIGLVAVTQMFFIVMTLRHGGQLSAGARVLQQLVAFVTNTFTGPIYATGFTLFYYDQRVRKEGYDIEWMMKTAGLLDAMDDAPAARPIEAASETSTAIGPAAEANPTGDPYFPDRTEHA